VTCSAFLFGWSPLIAQSLKAEALLQEGLIRYNVGQFERSIRILLRAQKKARDARVKAKIQLYLGLNYGVTGELSKARTAFATALTLDPSLDLKVSETKDSILDTFRGVRRDLKGQLVVRADRDGALVSVDGEQPRAAPFTGQLAVGKHKIVVTTPDGRFGYRGEVLIYAGKSHTIDAGLQLLSGKLKLTTRPRGAKVMIGKKELGQTPLLGVLLPPGRHKVSLTLEGHLPQTRTVDVKAYALAEVKAEMVPLPVATPPTRRRRRLWTWIAAGSSLAVAGTGLGLGIWAKNGWDQYQEAAANGDASYNDLREDVPKRCIAANVLFATAGALAVTAVVLLFLEAPKERPVTAATAGFSPMTTGYEF